jgi:DNA helicase-2/ATP-dependent DNA helicase PcrA
MPESSIRSRFLEEIPSHLLEDITRGQRSASRYAAQERPTPQERHYSYEDEDQRPRSLDNIAQFFTSRKPAGGRPKLEIPVPTGMTGFRSGQRVRHPKYGDGVVFRREGDGDDAKITVQFAQFGVKKLVEKFAQLEKL